MQSIITKSEGGTGAKPTAVELRKLKPPPERPYRDWTELKLSAPVVIKDGVRAIMNQCGGDSFGFGDMWRKTKRGVVPLFSIYKTINKTIKMDTLSTMYNIDPQVVCIDVCIDYTDTKTDRFWVSPSANLTPERIAGIKEELGVK